MNGNIFISYRRDDSQGITGRIYDRLEAHFGHDQIFMDVDTIPPGYDFVEVIEHAVDGSKVFLVIIGPQWLTAADNVGNRRLFNPEDFVRLEVATALERDVRVIPVLIDNAIMPKSSDLPDNLKSLSRRNAIEISYTRFNSDVERLIRALETKDIPNDNEKIHPELPKRQAVSSENTKQNDKGNNVPSVARPIKVSYVRTIGFDIISAVLGTLIAWLIIWVITIDEPLINTFYGHPLFIQQSLISIIFGVFSGGISGITFSVFFRRYIENLGGKLQILLTTIGSLIGGLFGKMIIESYENFLNLIILIITVQLICIWLAHIVYNFWLKKFMKT